ncbi:hypothetical protein GCK32_013701 [Trichostrongylus colubriformis]|uniref:Uncharacterized protein n=1 Tax=Trichostrongylus colubriformis TaxID=6319 RepID=A0AAN8IE84_TRICO
MRSRRSRASLKKAKSPKKKNNDDCKTSVEIEKPPPSIREKLSKKASKFFATTTTTTPATNGQQPPKEEKSVRQTTSIRERLKRGLKSAFSAFSKASFDKTVQNAKARMGYTAPKKGRPFWKDKRFRSEIPKNDRKPLSSLLFLIADKKLVLKDPVNPPAYMEAVDQDLDDLMSRDKKHFNEEIVLSNTVRSIIATLDGLDEFAKNQPQTIKNLEMKEPKTAISYSRHFPQKNEEVPFEYSGLGVCRSAKKKKGRHRRSSSSSSSSSSTTSDKDVSSKRTKRRRKSRDKEGKTEMASSKERDKSSRSSRRKRRKKK